MATITEGKAKEILDKIVNYQLRIFEELLKASNVNYGECLEEILSILCNVNANIVRTLSLPSQKIEGITPHDREKEMMNAYLTYTKVITKGFHNSIYHENDEECLNLKINNKEQL